MSYKQIQTDRHITDISVEYQLDLGTKESRLCVSPRLQHLITSSAFMISSTSKN